MTRGVPTVAVLPRRATGETDSSAHSDSEVLTTRLGVYEGAGRLRIPKRPEAHAVQAHRWASRRRTQRWCPSSRTGCWPRGRRLRRSKVRETRELYLNVGCDGAIAAELIGLFHLPGAWGRLVAAVGLCFERGGACETDTIQCPVSPPGGRRQLDWLSGLGLHGATIEIRPTASRHLRGSRDLSRPGR
jgi:hypothetical protein